MFMTKKHDSNPKTMLAGSYVGKGKVQVKEIPVPRIGPREVLIRVYTCGVCPTDLKKIDKGTLPPPLIFGHEIAGMIVKKGPKVKNWKVGQRASVYHHIPCRNCYYCKSKDYAQCHGYKKVGTTAGYLPAGGGFAEYVLVKDWVVKHGMTRIPSKVSYDEASFIEPVNTCLKGIDKLKIKKGHTVLIFGQGPVGLLLMQLAKVKGAKVIVLDPMKPRLQKAKALGAKTCLSPKHHSWIKTIGLKTLGRGVDISIVATANDKAIKDAIQATRSGGQILLFSHTQKDSYVPIDVGDLCVSDKSLLGSYSADIDLNREAAHLIFSRKINVKKLITHTFDLVDFENAIHLATHPTENSLKILIHPSPHIL